jgi:hypothetical protein
VLGLDFIEALPQNIPDLSYWLSYRKTITDYYVPDPRWAKEFYGKPHIWYSWAFDLQPQQTLEYSQSMRNPSWLISCNGYANQTAGWQGRILHVRRHRQIQTLYADQALMIGSGSYTYFIREPYRVRMGDSIILAVKNVSTSVLTGQMVMEAVEDVQQPA